MIKQLQQAFERVLNEHGLKDEAIEITARPLDVKEAIGDSCRSNLPLKQGKEVLMQAEFKGYQGQAYTDHPGNFKGKLMELLDMDMKENFNRALLVAAVNAITRYLGLASGTVHCRDEDLEKCGEEIARYLAGQYNLNITIGMIGFQPAIIENLANKFGADKVLVTDINPDNIGGDFCGVAIWDGKQYTEKLILLSDVVLATGSTVINNTLAEIVKLSEQYHKPLLLFGTSIAGPAALLGLERICPYGY